MMMNFSIHEWESRDDEMNLIFFHLFYTKFNSSFWEYKKIEISRMDMDFIRQMMKIDINGRHVSGWVSSLSIESSESEFISLLWGIFFPLIFLFVFLGYPLIGGGDEFSGMMG